jgi:G3E family GTPase
VHGAHQVDTQEEALKQIGVADRVVLTKTDIAPSGEVEALRARIRGINPGATLLTAVQGAIAASELFGAALDGGERDVERIAHWLRH